MTASDLDVQLCWESSEAFKRDLILARGRFGDRQAYVVLPGVCYDGADGAEQLARHLLLAEFEAGRTKLIADSGGPLHIDSVPIFATS